MKEHSNFETEFRQAIQPIPHNMNVMSDASSTSRQGDAHAYAGTQHPDNACTVQINTKIPLGISNGQCSTPHQLLARPRVMGMPKKQYLVGLGNASQMARVLTLC